MLGRPLLPLLDGYDREAGVALRLGLLDGPGTGLEVPLPVMGATLQVEDAGRAMLEALRKPSGIYVIARERQGLVRELP